MASERGAPVVADLLALAVVAGEAPPDALQRVCRLTGGELARDLDAALARARSGMPLTAALADLAERTTLEPFSRFVQGVVVAIERGTPLADVLRAQAADVREAGKRALLEAGGRKEISMMIPVVFMLLPVTVLFPLFPALSTGRRAPCGQAATPRTWMARCTIWSPGRQRARVNDDDTHFCCR
jgi:tight adherence protein C